MVPYTSIAKKKQVLIHTGPFIPLLQAFLVLSVFAVIMPPPKEKTNQKSTDSGDSEQPFSNPAPNVSSKARVIDRKRMKTTHLTLQEVTPVPDNPASVAPQPTGRVTRASNKTNRPGLVDVSPPTKKRRTGAELMQHRQDIANTKQARKDAAVRASELQQKQQREVAQMEDRIANQEERGHIHAARPPLGEIITKVIRPVSQLVSENFSSL